jgi:hypothetical protein
MSNVNAAEIYAKLLATENIAVIRARVSTASFDIKNRVLTLPQWKDMSPIVEGMLIGHEVGHALYTTDGYIDPIKEDPKLRSYMNVIEDVRIEKLMKRKYPGIRKTMTLGYQELNDRDFFGVKKVQDLSTLNLIDRINLYFKAGFSCGVKFTPEEKEFVNRVEKTETVEDVVALAAEVYQYSIEHATQRKKESLKLNKEDLEDMEEMLAEASMDEEDEWTDGSEEPTVEESDVSEENDELEDADVRKYMAGRHYDQKKTVEEQIAEDVEKEVEATTEKTFSEKLEELADGKTEYNYFTLDENHFIDPVVSYKTIIEETKIIDEEMFGQSDKKALEQFKVESGRVVNYLIKEFEMRKSAQLYKRAQTSKIGSLDMGKVWSYKLNDDLFKRVTMIPKGKNHGMIFLLDWSGSMQYVIDDTMQQVINLAMFCQRAQIPYQVFAFTTQYDIFKGEYDREKLRAKQLEVMSKENVLGNAVNSSFGLLELFSSKMSNMEFNTMVRRTFRSHYFMRCDGYEMGGTPLNESLSYLLGYLPKFAKSHNVEKMSLITLTDGEGGSLPVSSGRYLEDRKYDYNTHTTVQVKNFLKDPVTKKDYPITRMGTTQTEALLRMMKDRFDVKTVGFYICRNARRELSSAIENNLAGVKSSDQMIESIRREFRESGFASIKNTGRDDLFIVPQNRLSVDEGELVVDEKQNARQIARMFTKQMSGRKTSRVLLNQFIGYIA